jgi:hypothetical protein
MPPKSSLQPQPIPVCGPPMHLHSQLQPLPLMCWWVWIPDGLFFPGRFGSGLKIPPATPIGLPSGRFLSSWVWVWGGKTRRVSTGYVFTYNLMDAGSWINNIQLSFVLYDGYTVRKGTSTWKICKWRWCIQKFKVQTHPLHLEGTYFALWGLFDLS